MKKIFFTLAILAFIGGIALMSFGLDDNAASSSSNDNVYFANGKQIVEIDAKGGYWPRTTIAKADTPTIIKFKTKGTFDCSSAVAIPSLNYRTILSPSGETIVNVPPQKRGAELAGSCSMGMYGFIVKFN